MKFFVLACYLMSVSLSSVAQDLSAQLKLNEEKTYTPRAKGLKDLVVDLVNPKLTKQLNDQMIFGHLNEVVFRLYWTAEPARVAVEILGMPDGFREIKEELAASMIGNIEVIIPVPLASKFSTYQLKNDPKKPKIIVASDATHQQAIPEFEMTFNDGFLLTQIVAKKPIGTMSTDFTYARESWSDPRQVMTRSVTKLQEGPQSNVTTVDISYLVTSTMGLPSVMKTDTKQTINLPDKNSKPIERTTSETLLFKNYKVNTSAATKYFIGQAAPKE